MKLFIALFSMLLLGCNGSKNNKTEVQQSAVVEVVKSQSNEMCPAQALPNELTDRVQKEQDAQVGKTVIDTTKIYNMGEVDTPAMPTITEKELMENLTSRFKYPDIEPVNGKGVARLTIERDGSISDVKMVKSIHSELDKEYVRVLKLFPRFKAATIEGISVRSIVDFPIVAKSM